LGNAEARREAGLLGGAGWFGWLWLLGGHFFGFAFLAHPFEFVFGGFQR